MHKVTPAAALASLAAGIWALVSPWAYRSSSRSSAHMMGGHMMGGQGMQHSSGVVVDSSTYYWHIVPGALAIVLSLILLMAGRLVVERSIAAAVFVVGAWVLVGPWVLPDLGMGHSMNMGVTTGSFLRHIVPGVVLTVAAVVAYAALPARSRRRQGVSDAGLQHA